MVAISERSVKVNLIAQATGYVQGMEKAAKATREVGSEAEKLAQKKQALQTLGVAALGVGVAAAAGLTMAVAKFAEFDQAMSNVKAVTQESASNMGLLRDAALEFGASSVFTATEAANAIEELGKAGISTADILGGALEGSLNLASAGELGIARAAEIASTTLAQFGLAGEDAARVADTLAAGAGKALGSVDDLANGLKFVGPIAASMGVSLEETTGVLSAFAMQGILGEQAGTSLRGMLSSLTSPSKMARTEIERLGIQLYDGQGKFLGLQNAAGELQKAYGGMTDAQRDASLGLVFGNAQVTAARILYQEGAQGVAEWTDAVSESGYAAQIASDRLDNLNGDIEALGGAFDTYLIKSGSAANDSLRTLVQTLTLLVEGVGSLPQPMLDAGMAIGAVGGAVALAAGAALVGIPKWHELKTAASLLGISAGGAALKVGLIGGAIGVATAVISHFIGLQVEAAAKTEAYADSMEQATGRVTTATRELVKESLQAKPDFWASLFGGPVDSVYTSAEKLGLSIENLTDAALGSSKEFDELAEYLLRVAGDSEFAQEEADRLGITLGELQNAANNVSTGLAGEAKSLEEAAEATEQKQRADAEATQAAEEHEAALGALQGKAESTGESIEELADIIRGFGSATLDVREANRNLEQSYDDLTQSLIDNGNSLDITTEQGRANQSAIDDIVKATLEAAGATAEHTGSQEAAIPVIEAGRTKLLEMLAAFGITGQAAEDYVDELGLIPGNVDTAVALHTDAAEKALEDFLKRTSGRTVTADLYFKPVGQYSSSGLPSYASGPVRYRADGGAVGYASGGAIGGFGGPRQDNVPIMASPGEHMLDAGDVSAMGGQAAVYAFRRALHAGEQLGRTVPAPPQMQYVAAPGSAAQPRAAGPQRIQGTLDLGNGLTGYVRGIVRDAQDDLALDLEGRSNR